MVVVSRIRAGLAAAFLPLVLAACGSSDSSAGRILVLGEADDPFERGIHLSLAGQLARAATAEGLVSFDAEGRVVPALADRWIVTDDGKSYIFRLRDGTWLGGGQITAMDARIALRDAIRALRGTSLALDLAGIDNIRVMASRVIEIELHRPMPHLLQLLAQPELGLRRKDKTAGPMILKREKDVAVLSPVDPALLGLPEIENWEHRTRELHLQAVAGEEAVDRFNRGEADLVLGGRIETFPLTGEVGILRGTIQLDPVTGLFGLLVMNANGFLSEPANREAIAMTIDQQHLLDSFGVDGWTASTRIVSPDLEGDIGTIGERWTEMSLENRRALAAARISHWREGQEQTSEIRISVWLPEGPGSDMLFTKLATDLAVVGLRLDRARDARGADLQLLDDVARYPRAMWFLNRLACGRRRGLCERKADELAAAAARSDDPAERAALVAEAEAELTTANVFIPFGAPIRWSLVRGDFRGFATNRWGWHPLMPMATLPR